MTPEERIIRLEMLTPTTDVLKSDYPRDAKMQTPRTFRALSTHKLLHLVPARNVLWFCAWNMENIRAWNYRDLLAGGITALNLAPSERTQRKHEATAFFRMTDKIALHGNNLEDHFYNVCHTLGASKSRLLALRFPDWLTRPYTRNKGDYGSLCTFHDFISLDSVDQERLLDSFIMAF